VLCIRSLIIVLVFLLASSCRTGKWDISAVEGQFVLHKKEDPDQEKISDLDWRNFSLAALSENSDLWLFFLDSFRLSYANCHNHFLGSRIQSRGPGTVYQIQYAVLPNARLFLSFQKSLIALNTKSKEDFSSAVEQVPLTNDFRFSESGSSQVRVEDGFLRDFQKMEDILNTTQDPQSYCYYAPFLGAQEVKVLSTVVEKMNQQSLEASKAYLVRIQVRPNDYKLEVHPKR